MGKIKVPNTYVIIFTIIAICAIATWFVPGGEYVQQEIVNTDGTIEVIKIYQETDAAPQTWQIFSALFKGFSQQANIIIFVLIIGGAFWVVNSTKAVDTGIIKFIRKVSKLEKYSLINKIGVGNIVITLIMLLFGIFGAVFGMSEETIAFTAIIIPLAISLGYDSIVGVCMVYVAAHVGFSGAMLNPFTVGIAQDLSGLPLFSGIEYRTFCWFILMTFAITFVLIYASKIKKNPSKSLTYKIDSHWREEQAKIEAESAEEEKKESKKSSWFVLAITSIITILFSVFYAKDCVIKIGQSTTETPYLLWVISGLFILSSIFALWSSKRMYILNLLNFTILYLILGVMGYSWYINEIAALFMALALAAGIAASYSADKIVQKFLEGARDIFSAALVIGFAAGIVVILRDGYILDTLLHSMAGWLDGAGRTGALGTMYGIQTLINLFIPSATAKAAITMPIMAPFSDIIGVSRQATVLAFQFGDGFTNMITPCSGVLLAVLSVARIPYTTWVKWVWKFILALIILGFLLLLPTLIFNLPGF